MTALAAELRPSAATHRRCGAGVITRDIGTPLLDDARAETCGIEILLDTHARVRRA